MHDASLINWARTAAAVVRAAFLAAGTSACAAIPGVEGGITGISYQRDAEPWGVPDYWARPEETSRVRAGDCEDQALLGAWMAQQRGVEPERMRLVLGRLEGGQWHAWLEIDGEVAVDTALRAPRRRIYALALPRGWAHAADVRACILEGRCDAPAPAE